ncbi:OLC1v1013941C1 [Oldenlandia corymbosa var. corymbosa]|uniref:OLC1v1013941C1 n=1 Tax=Oldenlandia corymbosa var. corymbosa TaxID=529605 RepID=A0AAV1E1P2_OLDCO|nr:OLC1v1013941C1 [Oldenlandia corymbosa var. corymbosa]
MKPSITYLPFLLLCITYSNTLLCSSTAADPLSSQPEAVVDTLGRPVKFGDYFYYIKPADKTGKYPGGGLGLRGIQGNMSDSSCPLCVVQETIELRDGLAMQFYPVNKPDDGIIRVDTDLNIQFAFPDTCNQPTVWRLQKTKGKWFVNLGGEIGNPGPETVSNWFKFLKTGKSKEGYNKYLILYCPMSVCRSCNVVCKNVGIVMQNGKRRLGLAKKPYEIVFES